MQLNTTDFASILIFFLAMVAIGIWSYFRNVSVEDYFIGGGKIPWWLSGISHHVSGYSGAVFVAYAGIAYTHGLTIYVWWAFTIGITVLLSSRLFPVLWVKLRTLYQVQSPLEYLEIRYNLSTQQIMAWSGVILKLFDVGAKWAAIAILLQAYTGISLSAGILIAGGISLVYITFGGLWAVILTDFVQFLVQVVAGIILLSAATVRLGGWGSWFTFWEQLPPRNNDPFHEPYTAWFALAFLFINFLSYNGGTWNLATRYLASPDRKQATRAARLSGILYLVWPLILFLPMWAAPIFLPDLEDPTRSYAALTIELLPPGLIGLVLAALFASTMSMTSSDINTIAAVITRDILPALFKKLKAKRTDLRIARITTLVFTIGTILVALQHQQFGGVFGLIVTWFGALLGPVAIPMLFGLLPWFRRCGPAAAIASITLGLLTFVVTKNIDLPGLALEVSLPLMVSLLVYLSFRFLNQKEVPARVEKMLTTLNSNIKTPK